MEDEYMKRVRERFYKIVRETNWGAGDEKVCKPRGRKPKQYTRPESVPYKSLNDIKQSKYNWL
jgi:hypothetical protein